MVGALVASRRPRNPVGWLFLVIAVVSALDGVGDQYARFAVVTHHGSLPGAVWALWIAGAIAPLLFPGGVVSLTLLLLPNGRLPLAPMALGRHRGTGHRQSS